MIEITFPENEHAALKERLFKGMMIVTTRVSSEVGMYHLGEVYSSVFGNLKVISVEHYDELVQHPFLSELTEDQKKEISKYVYEAGMDIILLEKENKFRRDKEI